MPIVIESVSLESYLLWLSSQNSPPEQHEVIVGSLLGDMSAVKPNFCHYKSFYVQRIICHSFSKRNYIDFKKV